MFVELLSDEKKREIFQTLLMCVEADKERVEKSVKFRKIFRTANGFLMNYTGEFESKAVEIDDVMATISSETSQENAIITNVYQNEMLKVFKNKYAQFLAIKGAEPNNDSVTNSEELGC